MCLPWRRQFQNAKNSSKAAARGGTSSLPAAFRKCYETSSIWFGLSAMNKINPMIEQILVQRTNHIGLVWQHLRRTAGREDGYTLAAALEECLELLGILQNNQGRSQAAPLAASRQRTRCRDRTQPRHSSRIPSNS